MALRQVEVGLVSADDNLVGFYAAVFDMERLPVIEAGPGVVHRLEASGNVIKVMVPSRPPQRLEAKGPFFAVAGLRYLTMHTDDLDGTIERATARGGQLQHGPIDLGPGVRIAVLQDPDGNALEVLQGGAGGAGQR